MMSSHPIRRLLPVAIALAAAAMIAPMLDDLLLRAVLYPVPAVPVGAPPAEAAEVELRLDDGTVVVGWTADTAPGRPAMLYLHGNGENLETLRRAGLVAELRALDVAYLAVDYPGYGRSGGRPAEAGLIAAGLAAADHLRTRHPRRPLVIFGWSLGAAVATRVAAERPDDVAALIVASPWDTLEALGAVHFPRPLAAWAAGGRYDSLAATERVRCPVLWLHGTADRIIPIDHGRRLAAAFPGTVEERELPAGHNDLLGEPELWRVVGAFLDAVDTRSYPPLSG